MRAFRVAFFGTASVTNLYFAWDVSRVVWNATGDALLALLTAFAFVGMAIVQAEFAFPGLREQAQ